MTSSRVITNDQLFRLGGLRHGVAADEEVFLLMQVLRHGNRGASELTTNHRQRLKQLLDTVYQTDLVEA